VLALLLAVAFLLGLPLLQETEWRLMDWLFRRGRPNAPPPSGRIVHVDIDDSAIETIGRWPWPRTALAEAVEGLDRLGARVIALDILLTDPQEPQYTKDGKLVDHDARLAEAFRSVKARVVLAMGVDEAGQGRSSLWTSAEGRRKWLAILDLLRRDITLNAAEVIADADLEGERAARVRGRLMGFKQVVVRQAAEELVRQGRPCTEEALREVLMPAEKRAQLREFPGFRLIREAVELQRSRAAMDAHLPAAVPGHAYVEIADIIPPLPLFAEAAFGEGVVNSTQDGDGRLRRVTARWEGHGRIYPQLGLAAAAAYRALPSDDLAAPELRLGAFDLDGEELLLSWPRIDEEYPILGMAPHLSLGRVVALARAEDALGAMEEKQLGLSRYLVKQYLQDQFEPTDLDDPEKRPAVEEELMGEAGFRVPDNVADIPEDKLEPETKAWVQWRNLTLEAARSRRELALARRDLGQAIQDRLVFVGWNATGNFSDFFATAVHVRTPGVVAHAVVANSVLSGYVVREAPRWLGALLTVLLGLGAAVLTAASGPRLGFLLAVLLAIVYFGASTLLAFDRGQVFLATATPITGILVAWAGTVVMRAVRERREKAQLRKQFGARISKQLFDYLLENPGTVRLEGEEKEVTCFFSDLAGFTSISERLDSRQTVKLLNDYMWAMNDELTRLSAYVNKFLGDGIMAIWGAFAADPRDAENACRAALACQRRLDRLNREPRFEGLPRLAMRIGIATGVVTVGDCGAPPDLQDYTVIGDTANLAARLESANKQFGTRVLVNGRTRALLPPDLVTRPLGRIAVVGQQTPTEIHELMAVRGEETPEQRDLVERTARAVDLFTRGDFAAARGAWEELVAAHGPSRLADLYLGELAAREAESGAPFDGVLRLTSK